jgi:hypothetical protein
MTHEEHLQQQREYSQKRRDKYRAEGKDSRGRPLQAGAKSWTPEQHARFRATVEAKRLNNSQSPKGHFGAYSATAQSQDTALIVAMNLLKLIIERLAK